MENIKNHRKLSENGVYPVPDTLHVLAIHLTTTYEAAVITTLILQLRT